jgi:hypothetical protein
LGITHFQEFDVVDGKEREVELISRTNELRLYDELPRHDVVDLHGRIEGRKDEDGQYQYEYQEHGEEASGSAFL